MHAHLSQLACTQWPGNRWETATRTGATVCQQTCRHQRAVLCVPTMLEQRCATQPARHPPAAAELQRSLAHPHPAPLATPCRRSSGCNAVPTARVCAQLAPDLWAAGAATQHRARQVRYLLQSRKRPAARHSLPTPYDRPLPLPRRLRARGLGSGSGATFPHDDYEAWSWWWPEGELPEVSMARSHTCLA